MTYYNLGAGGPYYFTTKMSVVKPPTIVFFRVILKVRIYYSGCDCAHNEDEEKVEPQHTFI